MAAGFSDLADSLAYATQSTTASATATGTMRIYYDYGAVAETLNPLEEIRQHLKSWLHYLL